MPILYPTSVFKEPRHLSAKVGVQLLPRTLHMAMPLKLWIILMPLRILCKAMSILIDF